MTVETKLSFDKAYIEQFSKDRNEPEWMLNFRLDAIEQAEKLEMPKPDKTTIRNWNFTDFNHEFKTGEAVSSVKDLPEELRVFFDEDKAPENLIIQRNHSVAYASLSEDLKEKGVIFVDLLTAIREHGDLVQKYFMTEDGVSVNEHKLTALHAALVNGGVFLYVPQNVQIETPIQTIFWQEDPDITLINHVLVVVDKNSSITYVENNLSHNAETETVANIITEVHALDGAKVAYGAVDNFAAATTTYVNRRGIAGRDATIDWALGQMNDGNTISENVTRLVGDNSTSQAKAVSVGRGNQTQNFTSVMHHDGKASDGFILQRGVMREASTAIFNAIGKIEHGGTKANSEQESRVLMLSEKARGDANPILLIDEDDVTAGHAASVGRVDPIQMYYLKSRGLTDDEAQRLLIHGFLDPVVSQLPIDSVKQQLKHVIERKIN
ncbi:Fe-S cluster assembly protein SufD [Oceanobacillus luteolus]|uniref:Fe-S cluster assembly protein SufD n=1 Tax=Oceanobacillus luteolus TaxID=1274358 RepID=A0ABW4HSK2_9BACI|nr:Fe-S cluster assembly protein SufD [Oceanobacillus luteolus]MCM3739325.1 Fe-S cluster assembly protein SufD [Oceanobacillus luteolus]